MKAYFKALRESGLQGIFLSSGQTLHIIGAGLYWVTAKPANDNDRG